jgi:hypothetical protein
LKSKVEFSNHTHSKHSRQIVPIVIFANLL